MGTAASFDPEARRWSVSTSTGKLLSPQFVVFATGMISEPLKPSIPGYDMFKGRLMFTSTWPEDSPSFDGRRVGVIGAGSSGVQVIPKLAAQAAHLSVFMRSPPYVVPARN